MIKLRFLALLSVLALMLSLPAVASAQAAPPHVVIGTVMVDGKVAPQGTEVTALIEGQEQVSALVDANGEYGPLFVEPGKGPQITFRVGALIADQSVIWEKGGADVVHLTASSDSPSPSPKAVPPPPFMWNSLRGQWGVLWLQDSG